MTKSKFTLDWYKGLGWRSNPFEDKVLSPISYFFTGYEEERRKINYFIIEREPFGTIAAEKGMGKKAILQWTMSEMRRYKNRVRAYYVLGEELDREEFLHLVCTGVMGLPESAAMKGFFGLKLHKAYNWVTKKLRIKIKSPDDSFYKNIHRRDYADMMKVRMFLHSKMENRGVLFLVDEAQELSEHTMDAMKDLYEAELPIQIILASDKEGVHDKSGRHFGVKDSLKIKLKPLKYADARELIKKRVQAVGGDDIWPFDDTTLSELWDESEKKPKQYLKVCYDWAVKQSLKGLKVPKKMRSEKPIHYDQASGFEMPDKVKKAWESGDLTEKEKKEYIEKEDYQIKVKDRGSESIPMDLGEEPEEDTGYKIREAKR